MAIVPTVDVTETRRRYARLLTEALNDDQTPGVITEEELQNIADGMARWIGTRDTWEDATAAMTLGRQQLKDAAAHCGNQWMVFSGQDESPPTPLAYDPLGDAAYHRAVELWLRDNEGLFKGVARTGSKDVKLIEKSLPKIGWNSRQHSLETKGGAVTYSLDGRADHNSWYHFHYTPNQFGATAEGLLWIYNGRQYIALRPVGDGTFAGVYTDPYEPDAAPGHRFEYRIVLRLNSGQSLAELDYLKREIDVETRKPRMDEGALVRSELSEGTTLLFRKYAAGE